MIQPYLNAGNPIIEDDGTMTQEFRVWTQRVSVGGFIYTGIGSPEGNLVAPQYTLYLDITTPTAPVQYRKMLGSIGGDEKQGWVAL